MSPPSTDRRVFVDTSAYFAATSRRDASSATASAMAERLVLARQRFITTNAVLFELHGLLLARGPRTLALAALTRIYESPATTIIRLQRQDEERGWNIILQYDDKDFSLTDASSFAVMERLGIGVAFTLDRHFAQFGWEVSPLETGRRGD